VSEKPRILLLLYHGSGHFNACFKLAEILSQRYDIIFAGVEFFKNHVTRQGFSFYPLRTVPFGLGLEHWVNSVQKRRPVYLHTVRDRWSDSLYHERKTELDQMLNDVLPDFVLLDAQQCTDFLVLYQHLRSSRIRVAILHTMFPTTLLPGFPPVNSIVLPNDKDGIDHAHRTARRNSNKKRWLQKLMFLGCDDNLIIQRRIRRNNIPSKYLPSFPSAFNYAIQGVPQLIIAPEALDFKMDPCFFPCEYLGSWISLGRKEDSHADFRRLQHTVFDVLAAKHLTLIYCSFGTIPARNRKRVLRLLHKLTEATRNQQCLLMVSLKLEGSRLKESPPKADHVYIFDYLPQLEILAKARLFITHGGLNSIKESITFGVPMLVYPLEHKVDQRGNASRVLYHRIGLQGDVETDSIADIRLKISALLTDPSYRRNILKMHETTRDENAEKLFSCIDRIQPLG